MTLAPLEQSLAGISISTRGCDCPGASVPLGGLMTAPGKRLVLEVQFRLDVLDVLVNVT